MKEIKILFIDKSVDEKEKEESIKHFEGLLKHLRYFKTNEELSDMINKLNELALALNSERFYELDFDRNVIISKSSLIKLEGNLI